MSERTPLVALVKVTKYLIFKSDYPDATPLSMEVEIVEIYKGKESRKTITVWGDDGHLCRPYISEFKKGAYYVIAFDKAGFVSSTGEKETDYSITKCGAYWLAADYEKATVSGDIDSENRTSSTTSLAALKARLSKMQGEN